MCALGGDRFAEAGTLDHLAETHLAAGDAAAAHVARRQALTILGQLGHGDAARVGARLAELDQATAGSS
jgi:hypothetical protein